MAREYEVREEYRKYSLGQLMDSPLTCFQGVGDIQAEMLKQYFSVSSILEMANFQFFLWALAIQETAMDGNQGGTPVQDLGGGADARFHVREAYRHLSAIGLMNGPIHALEGLTPAQDLALYDIFRITNITHLAHNRIMLESRVIQVLQKQEAAEGGGGVAGTDEVDHVLGRSSTSALASAAVQRITEGRRAGRDERLAALEQETTEHIRGRLETLRERARDRASSLPSREGGSRLATIQQSKERAETTGRMGTLAATTRGGVSELRSVSVVGRRTTTLATVGRAGVSETRGSPLRGAAERGPAAGKGTDSRASSVLAARGVSSRAERAAEASTSRAAAVSAARGGAPFRPSGGGGGGGGSYRGGGGGGSSTATATRTTTTTTVTSRTATTGAAEAAGAGAAGVTAPAAAQRQPARSGFQPWMAAAALGIVVLILVLWFALRPASTPPTAPVTQTAATGQATQAGTAGQPGAAATSTATATAPAKPATPIRAVHEVQRGQSLWRISRFYYELGSRWRRIFDENQEQIKEPDLIYPKQKFRIPQ